jgi:hypothetical protein
VSDEAALRERLERVTEAARDLARRHDPADPALAAAMADLYDSATAEAADRFPAPQAIACKKGCSSCCRLRVKTDQATVARIVAHLREHWSATERAALLQRGRRVIEHQAGDRAGRPTITAPLCPFVVADACSIHAVRPLACRGLNSYALAACLKAASGRPGAGVIPGWLPAQALYRAVATGLAEGQAARGFEDQGCELTMAVVDALL